MLELRRGETRFEETCAPEALGLDDGVFRQPVRVAVEAMQQPGGWALTISCGTVAHRVCDRCTAEVDLAVDATERVLLVENESRPDLEDLDDVLVVGPEDEGVDLDQPLRDALVTALPDRFLCREDCRGLCAQCGQDLNEGDCDCEAPAGESPFAGLARLRRSDEDDEQ